MSSTIVPTNTTIAPTIAPTIASSSTLPINTTVDQHNVSIVLAGSVDAGKCFGIGTLVMNYNGSFSKVEDIKVGDKLMGDDSCSRTILETHTGSSQLYKISPNFGNAYIVNGQHILCLKNGSDIIIQDENEKEYGPNAIIEISVNNFMLLDNNIKSILKWYKVGVDFCNTTIEETEIDDPYKFGSNIINYTCIPNSYKYGSMYTRILLLSGIYDKYSTKTERFNIMLTTSYKQLIIDTKYVIESLGYVICEKLEHDEYYSDNANIKFIDSITGSSFKIEKYGFGKYYGFELDGNGRFLLGDFSVAHNSSFIGVITSGELDDGNGSARNKVAKHPHEIITKKTSDISIRNLHIGNKNISMIDLCGHEKYLKTTVFGITGYFPDYGIVIIAANRGMLVMTKEHIKILHCLKIPFIIIITHVDLVTDNDALYIKTIEGIVDFFKKSQVKRTIRFINSNKELKLDKEQLIIAENKSNIRLEKLATIIKNNHKIVPVITISNKTGYYIDSVKYLLTNLQPRNIWQTVPTNKDTTIFYIDDKFAPGGIGLVVSGIMKGDTIKVGDNMLIGPYGKTFLPIRVWSIHDNERNQISELKDKQRGCLAIRVIDKKIKFTKDAIRKGFVVISKNTTTGCICYQFSADIQILNHSTTISHKYSPMIQCGIIRQSARIILENGQVLKMGDRAIVKFRFVSHPEFMEVGTTFIFREGVTRGVGTITELLNIDDDPNQLPSGFKKRLNRKKIRSQQMTTITTNKNLNTKGVKKQTIVVL